MLNYFQNEVKASKQAEMSEKYESKEKLSYNRNHWHHLDGLSRNE